MKDKWTASAIIRLYRIDRAKTSIYRDETEGTIPKAQRVKRGKTYVRSWPLVALPEIGKKYGFLIRPETTKVISVYSPKGGVLKSTFSFNLARVLAINGINVLVIGLDVQGTVSTNLKLNNNEEDGLENITEIKDVKGLYEASKTIQNGGCSLEDTILDTDLPNLKYIPESSNLVHLEQKIRDESKREYVLDRLIKPIKKKFDVIIFDNSPNWNFLIQNSLVAATDVICPIACDIETYRSLTQNIQMINDYKNKLELNWNSFILISTKLERTRISTQIDAQYKTLFPELITPFSIRSAAKGQESSLGKVSAIEYDPESSLADDYYSVTQDVWTKINAADVKQKSTQKNIIVEKVIEA
jgi:chromosome partitioning protein